jgi:carbon monoxide dehydrogenase subunit G
MASIHKEILVNSPSEKAWGKLRDFARPQDLVPGFVVDCKLDGDARVVTFFSGLTARELLVDINDASRRLAYGEVGGRFIFRSAALQVFGAGAGACRIVWTVDMLPNDFAVQMATAMEQGLAIMKTSLEGSNA